MVLVCVHLVCLSLCLFLRGSEVGLHVEKKIPIASAWHSTDFYKDLTIESSFKGEIMALFIYCMGHPTALR